MLVYSDNLQFEEAAKLKIKIENIKNYRTISQQIKLLKNNILKLKETLKLEKFQIYRELSDGRLKLSYNRRYLKNLEKQIHRVCHTRHYKGARKRDLRELTKYVNQIIRALRKESRYLWVLPEQKRGFNREVKKAVKESLTSMYGFKKERALAYIEKFILFWK